MLQRQVRGHKVGEWQEGALAAGDCDVVQRFAAVDVPDRLLQRRQGQHPGFNIYGVRPTAIPAAYRLRFGVVGASEGAGAATAWSVAARTAAATNAAATTAAAQVGCPQLAVLSLYRGALQAPHRPG